MRRTAVTAERDLAARTQASQRAVGARQQAMGLSLRPITPEDRDLLHRIYAGTRAEELAMIDWDEARKAAFVTQQFEAQHSHYRQHYREARFDIVERAGRPVGRLYVDRGGRGFRIVDIALLPEERGAGIGTALIRDLQDEAAAAGRRVSIHVERYNRALDLYRRLGFAQVGDHGVYLLMDWAPPGAAAETA